MDRFILNTDTYFGAGTAGDLGKLLTDRSFKTAAIIADGGVAKTDGVRNVLSGLEKAGIVVHWFHALNTSREPTYDELDGLVASYPGGDIDVVIGIGGGSAMDTAKAFGILLKNPRPGIQYRGMDLVPAPGVPVVLLPTTAGSGSEVTPTAVFVDSRENVKFGINGRHVRCAFSILDPEMLFSCPKSVTIGSGIDALVHAVEAVSSTENPVARAIGCEAVRYMFRGLPKAVAFPNDTAARADTMIGSHLAGLTLAMSRGGPAGAISYPLGSILHVPHGIAGGIFLPFIVETGVERGYFSGYAALYDRLETATPRIQGGEEARAREFVRQLKHLYEEIGVPSTLTSFGVTRANVEEITRITSTRGAAGLKANPVPFGEPDVRAMLEFVTV